MQYKISELASYIDAEKCTSTGGRNFAKETYREGFATEKQIEFWNKLPKKIDAPFTKIDINSLSKNEQISVRKTDEPMITIPVRVLENLLCQR